MARQTSQPATPIDLSIVIPAYNEAARIGPTLTAIAEFSRQTELRCELIVVDDGSTDGTVDVVRAFSPEGLAVRLLESAINSGKGAAVRQGMLAAAGDAVLMSDADMSTPIEEVERLLPWLERGYEVVIASRDLPDSRLDPPQPFVRRFMAWGFRTLRRLVLLPKVRDTQCGFKLFERAAARAIFSRATVDGWLFDCEVLAIAADLGHRIREIGVTWRNHPHSKVNAWRELVTSVPVLLSIRRGSGRNVGR